MAKMQFGVVIFDDPTEHAAGWAGILNQEPRRIGGTHDLSTESIWWTNIESGEMIASGLYNNARFRPNEFLRRKQEHIIEQLGLAEVTVSEKIIGLTQIVNRVVDIARNVEMPSIEDSRMINNLRHATTSPDPLLEPVMQQRILDANKIYTNVQRYGQDVSNPEYCSFLLPPLNHAQNLLRMPLPYGDWSRINPVLLPQTSNPKNVLDWTMAQKNLFIAQVSIDGISEIINEIMNLGKDINTSPQNRRWLTSVELAAICGTVDSVEILTVWENSKSVYLCDLWDYAAVFIGGGDNWDLSYSTGLFAEMLWCGLCAGYWPKSYRKKTSRKVPTNNMSPFIRAFDRMLCLEKALQIDNSDIGLVVRSYGTGKVVAEISAMESQTALFSMAKECSLLPPRLDGLEMRYTPKEGGDVARCLFSLSPATEILMVDEHVVNSLVLPALEKCRGVVVNGD